MHEDKSPNRETVVKGSALLGCSGQGMPLCLENRIPRGWGSMAEHWHPAWLAVDGDWGWGIYISLLTFGTHLCISTVCSCCGCVFSTTTGLPQTLSAQLSVTYSVLSWLLWLWCLWAFTQASDPRVCPSCSQGPNSARLSITVFHLCLSSASIYPHAFILPGTTQIPSFSGYYTFVVETKIPNLFSPVPSLSFSPDISHAGCKDSAPHQRQQVMSLAPASPPFTDLRGTIWPYSDSCDFSSIFLVFLLLTIVFVPLKSHFVVVKITHHLLSSPPLHVSYFPHHCDQYLRKNQFKEGKDHFSFSSGILSHVD